MPRLPEAKKDAASCENARGTASRYRSVRVRMGQPGRQEACHRRRKKTSMAPVAASEEAGAQTGPVEAGAG